MIETQKHIRKPLYVDAVRIANANFDEIAAWCQGEILEDEGGKRYIKVRVHNPKNPRQTKAFVGDWLLYTERGYKVYTNKAFHASFDPVGPSPEEKDRLAVEALDAPLSEDEEFEANKRELRADTSIEAVATPVVPQSEMAQAVETIEAEGGTIEAATPEAIADAVQQNEQTQVTAETTHQGKTVITLEEQAEMDQDEIRELLKSGEYILAQDLAA